jgi:catechol 2,3-dioxygenase-like lactoylglutathione lyase family enzyme
VADRAGAAARSKSAIWGVDHCVLGVHDLEAARARYTSLGFTVTPRGRHIGWATANYCVMFPDDYIELLGIVEAGAYSAGLDVILAERGEGILKLALGTGDAGRTHEFFAEGGVARDPVAELARELEAPGGTVLPKFRLVHPQAAATPGLASFVCQHLTPDLLRRPEWCMHRNSATGIASYAVLADEPAALADGWTRIFGADAVATGGGRLTVETGAARLDFMTRDALAREFDGIEIAAPKAGTIAAMTVAVADLTAVAGCLAEVGVACLRSDRGLVVPPEDACGAVLAFSQVA